MSTQVAVLKELREKEGYTFSKQYFGKIVKQGKIPYYEDGGKKRFRYKDVSEALKQMKQKSSDKEKTKPANDEEKFNLQNEDGSTKTINSTKIMLQDYQAKIAKQKYDLLEGQIVLKEEVESKAFEVARILRNQIMALPERMGGILASHTDPKEVKEILYKELEEVMSILSEGEALYEH